ncbi:MAG: SpoIIE family protein phosphatase [Bacteroidia bacterium]|nr:SpoIIE family protein phosphatase [Bacteroidia bacterium]MDW8235231.1 SpoIIE family protein phosphatase [Bacteroidia bacterium]
MRQFFGRLRWWILAGIAVFVLSTLGVVLILFSALSHFVYEQSIESYEAPASEELSLRPYQLLSPYLSGSSLSPTQVSMRSATVPDPFSAKIAPEISLSLQEGRFLLQRRFYHSFERKEKPGITETYAVSYMSSGGVLAEQFSKIWMWQGKRFDYMTMGKFGDIWASSPRYLMRWDGQRIEAFPIPESITLSQSPIVCEDSYGVWAVSGKDLLFYDGLHWYHKSLSFSYSIILPHPQEGVILAQPWEHKLYRLSRDSLWEISFGEIRIFPIGWIEDTLVAAFSQSDRQGLLFWRENSVKIGYATVSLWRSPASMARGEGRNKIVFASDAGTFVYASGKLHRVAEMPPLLPHHLAVSKKGILMGTQGTYLFVSSHEGEWITNNTDFVQLNLAFVGYEGELWLARSFGETENFIAVVQDDLVEEVQLPFQNTIQDLCALQDKLWLLSDSGGLWRGTGRSWEYVGGSPSLGGCRLLPDPIHSDLWIVGSAPLMRFRSSVWEIFPIDSVERVSVLGDKLWILRKGVLYANNIPLPWRDVRFIGRAGEQALWVVRDSGVYVIWRDTLWLADRGRYEGLTIDSQERLWCERSSRKGQSAICYELNPRNETVHRFELGFAEGLQGTSRFIGGTDTLWWQSEKNRLSGLVAGSVSYRRYQYSLVSKAGLSLISATNPAYVYMSFATEVQKVAQGLWRDKRGVFLLTGGKVYFYQQDSQAHAIPAPRLRLRIRTIAPVLHRWASWLQKEIELGPSSGLLEENSNAVPLELAVPLPTLETRGKWPAPSWASFETSYFSYDLTFTFSPAGRLRDLPDIEYRYRLVGYGNATWSRPSRDPRAYFYHLPEGEYTLEVRARRLGGQWSSPARWSFRVAPPLWRTTAAYILYGILGIGAVLLFVRYRVRALRRQAAYLQEEVRKATATIQAQNQALLAANQELEFQRKLAEAQKQDLIDSIAYAQRIQRALLPSAAILQRFFPESFVFFLPRDLVSGDTYWFFSPPSVKGDEELLMLVADCTGHGVPGAFMSLLTLSLIERVVKEIPHASPGTMLDTLSAQIIRMLNPDQGEEIKDGFEGVLCRFRRSSQGWYLEYAAARRSFWRVRGDKVEEFPKDPIPVGLSEIPALRGSKFTTHTLTLEKGDWLYFSSDGYTDQLGGEMGQRFGIKRFRVLLQELTGMPASAQPERLKATLDAWRIPRRLPQVDDVLVVGVKIG